MEIYFLRHAIALTAKESETTEEQRPLSQEGIKKMRLGAKGLLRLIDSFDVILTSPLVRAKETARIVCEVLGIEPKMKECPELMPASTKKTIISLLADHAQKKRILVVGHEPELGLAISALIGAETPALELKKGGIVRVDFDDFLKEHKGTLIYSLPPKILRMAGKKQPHK